MTRRGRRGSSQDFLPQAFERFTRADAAREGDGSGLGLAIVDDDRPRPPRLRPRGEPPGGGADVWISLPIR